MFTRIREQLSYANIMATIAVFLALGGAAYALARNSVKSKHIAPEAVRSSDIGDGQVRTADLANGAVSRGKLAPGAVPAPVSVAFDEVTEPGFTDSAELTQLETAGPAVTVTIPPGAIVSVTTSVVMGTQQPDPTQCAAEVVPTPGLGSLFLGGVSGTYPGVPPTNNLQTDVRRASLQIQPGTYDFELRYRADGVHECFFLDRRLWVEVSTAPPG